MVSLFQAHAASAIVIGSALCLTTCAGSRASVSFRPPIPASYFDSNPSFALDPAKFSPTAIAQAFFASSAFLDNATLLRDPFPPSFFIRPDSYTDDTTGITHVYARQQAHYWEISNAHINLNIRNGVVLSHGSSLFSGDISSNIVPVPSWTLDDYCASSFTASSNFTCGHFRNRLCALSATINLTVSEFNPIPAAYLFTLAAYPGPIPSNTSIEQVYNGLYDCGTLHNWNGRECWAAYNLPFVLSPVKGYKMYIQTPAKGSNLMKLSPVWCLEVELAENQYEVYVSLNDPSKVVMVADWAADGPSWKWSDLAGSSKKGRTVCGGGTLVTLRGTNEASR
ncbi:Fungalysin/Thermolysin Extracellular metalloproteinase 5 [Ceratobasidium sp. 394]|nr:Fungalysin/Thermolysin Extracellular metalloproteinase 5 [Ceratobasidium sp. 394]